MTPIITQFAQRTIDEKAEQTLRAIENHVGDFTALTEVAGVQLLKELMQVGKMTARHFCPNGSAPKLFQEEWYFFQKLQELLGEKWKLVFNSENGWPYLELAIIKLHESHMASKEKSQATA